MQRERKVKSGYAKCTTDGCPTTTRDQTGKCAKCKAVSSRTMCAVCNGFADAVGDRFFCRRHKELEINEILRFRTDVAIMMTEFGINALRSGGIRRVKKTATQNLRCEPFRFSDAINAELLPEYRAAYLSLIVAINTFDAKMSSIIDRAVIKGVVDGTKEITDLLDIATTDNESEAGNYGDYLSGEEPEEGEESGSSDCETRPPSPEAAVQDADKRA